MATNGIDSVSPFAAREEATVARKPNDELGKDSFLQLLVTQMQNQDPLNPTQDTEFIAQLATFSTLEQLQNMNSSMQTTQAASMIGKQVTWQEVADGSTKTYFATVESVRVDGSNVYLVVDSATGKEIEMSQVLLIEDADATGPDAQLSQASALIGKEISWYEADEEGEPVEKTGVVSTVRVAQGKAYLIVGKDAEGKDIAIPLSSVASVQNPGENKPETPDTP